MQAHGAVEGLAKVLLWEELDFATTAAAVLGHVAGSDAQVRRDMVGTSGLVAGLARLLSVDSTQSRVYSAGTLANLAHDCPANQVRDATRVSDITSIMDR